MAGEAREDSNNPGFGGSGATGVGDGEGDFILTMLDPSIGLPAWREEEETEKLQPEFGTESCAAVSGWKGEPRLEVGRDDVLNSTTPFSPG